MKNKDLKIYLAAPRGFCAGVDRAIEIVKKAIPLTILTGVICFISLYLLNNSYNLNDTILKVIFIGLASLTFPHILLEYFLEKNEK